MRRACSTARKRTGGRTRYGFGRSSPGSRRPSVVLHCRGDRVARLEEVRYMARLIPGASFIELPGNHHALLGHWQGRQGSTNSSKRLPTSSSCMTAKKTLDRNLMSPERLAVILIGVLVIGAIFVVLWGLFAAPS
jgi:hypothetical protein